MYREAKPENPRHQIVPEALPDFHVMDKQFPCQFGKLKILPSFKGDVHENRTGIVRCDALI